MHRGLPGGLHPRGEEDRMVYIDPDECIDCGACVDPCPVDAIYAEEDVPDAQVAFVDINKVYFKDKALARSQVAGDQAAGRDLSPRPNGLCAPHNRQGPDVGLGVHSPRQRPSLGFHLVECRSDRGVPRWQRRSQRPSRKESYGNRRVASRESSREVTPRMSPRARPPKPSPADVIRDARENGASRSSTFASPICSAAGSTSACRSAS